MGRSLLARTAAAATICAALACTGAASAQSAPPLGAMPMPPSASDPAPKDSAKPKSQPKKAAKPRKKAVDDETISDGVAPAAAKPRARGANSAATGQGYDRPKRYVPEEFDRGGDDGRAKPFMSESGRPGMGMRF